MEFIPYLFPFLFVAMWFTVTTVLRTMAHMVKQLDVETGPEIRCSR